MGSAAGWMCRRKCSVDLVDSQDRDSLFQIVVPCPTCAVELRAFLKSGGGLWTEIPLFGLDPLRGRDIGVRSAPGMPALPSGPRSLKAAGKVRPHVARRELGTATPTAIHPRPRWAATLI